MGVFFGGWGGGGINVGFDVYIEYSKNHKADQQMNTLNAWHRTVVLERVFSRTDDNTYQLARPACFPK